MPGRRIPDPLPWRAAAAALLLLIACPSTPALAQIEKALPDMSGSGKGKAVAAPDWSAFLSDKPAAPASPALPFYEVCMLNTDPGLSDLDHQAMCACMAERKAAVDRQTRDADDDSWRHTLGDRTETAYEIFVSKIQAPCAYIEGRQLVYSLCRSDTSLDPLFHNQADRHGYCLCYADGAEFYMRHYAEPLLAARLAQSDRALDDSGQDALTLVMQDIDYTLFMDRKRHQCYRLYGF